MSDAYSPPREPVAIGEVTAPPFVRLPDPASVFRARAERFQGLAPGHQLGAYLAFLADVAAAQDTIQPRLTEPAMPDQDEVRRSHEFGMPAIDRNRFPRDPAFAETLDLLLEALRPAMMPDPARDALAFVATLDDEARARMAQAVLDAAVPFEAVAEHVLVAAALQVHAARSASRLDPAQLGPLDECLCPACGSAPVTSQVVGWHGSHGARFCACSLCSTLWNYVRVRCTACGTTESIAYREIEGQPDTVKAETCDICRSYLKVLYQMKDPALDPVADDVASLAVDLLVVEDGYRRGGVNPFLIGY